MIHMTLKEAAALLDIKSTENEHSFTGLSIDTRTLTKGALFIAIPGERVDGHDFINQAQEKGAAAALVTRPIDSTLPQLVVTDIVEALGKLGTAWRKRFNIPFFAVTGSNGKTTLKNLIGSILKAAAKDPEKVLITQGNLNNHLGLPLTLSRLSKNHEYAVIEMGMNHFGEIEYLTKLTQPDFAAITNAGPAHLEGVKSLEGVAKAKAEIFLGLSKEGVAILNHDDQFCDYWRKQVGSHPVITFGLTNKADVYATIHDDSNHLTIHTPKGEMEVHLPLLGKHNVQNALAASALAIAGKIDLTFIKQGLESIAPEKGRMQAHKLNTGTMIIDDTYNANPLSLEAAFRTLAALKGQRILVLGDMKELGKDEKEIHQKAGRDIHAAGIDRLFTLGNLTALTSHAFGEGAKHYDNETQLIDALKSHLTAETTILVKGSRSMHMENIVKGLLHQGG